MPPAQSNLAINTELFLQLSETLTGFSRSELQGSGSVEDYLALVHNTLGERLFERLITTWAGVASESDPDARAALLEARVLESDLLGPVARNIIKLWLVGIWPELPRAWRMRWGGDPLDLKHLLSDSRFGEGPSLPN